MIALLAAAWGATTLTSSQLQRALTECRARPEAADRQTLEALRLAWTNGELDWEGGDQPAATVVVAVSGDQVWSAEIPGGCSLAWLSSLTPAEVASRIEGVRRARGVQARADAVAAARRDVPTGATLDRIDAALAVLDAARSGPPARLDRLVAGGLSLDPAIRAWALAAASDGGEFPVEAADVQLPGDLLARMGTADNAGAALRRYWEGRLHQLRLDAHLPMTIAGPTSVRTVWVDGKARVVVRGVSDYPSVAEFADLTGDAFTIKRLREDRRDAGLVAGIAAGGGIVPAAVAYVLLTDGDPDTDAVGAAAAGAGVVGLLVGVGFGVVSATVGKGSACQRYTAERAEELSLRHANALRRQLNLRPSDTEFMDEADRKVVVSFTAEEGRICLRL